MTDVEYYKLSATTGWLVASWWALLLAVYAFLGGYPLTALGGVIAVAMAMFSFAGVRRRAGRAK